MLVFWRGAWHEVTLPPYMDPSWGVTEQTRLALALLKGRAAGRSDDTVLQEVEALILGKEHGAPQDGEK
jgi:hypothetical protein